MQLVSQLALMDEAKDIIDDLVDERDELESNLTIETGKRTDLEIQLEKGEKLISQLQEKIDIIENDLLLNWITRDEHKQVEKRLKEEIVNGEAQLAAVRMEMESLRNEIKIHVEEKKAEEIANKENVKEQQKRRTIEISDDRHSTLEKCVEICSFSLDHLNGLAQFMSNLLQQKEFCESLSEATMNNMQCVINKTFELSNHAARFSISIDGCRMSSLPNISSLDLLMATARNSLGSIRDLCGHNKSFHDAKNEQIETMEVEMGKIKEDLLTARSEIDKLNQHNVILQEQVKEGKVQYERLNSGRNQLIEDIRNELKKVETENELLTTQMNEAKDIIDDLVDERDELESNLTIETGKRTDLKIQLEKGEKLISQLQEKIDIIENDLLLNWITRDEHKQVEKRLKEEIVNGEAQLAAVQMEMESLRNEIKIHVEEKKAEEIANKENVKEQQKRRTIEISDDRRLMLMNEAADSLDEISNPSEPSSCQMCTKYQSKILELKKYLSRAIEKIKMQSEIKAQNDRHIQKQLSNTESFLHSARANMENILKSRNVPQE
ncbi:CLUMA_CG019296, isoform A [Clunio marinus]|uniref:CLUMA_CG019296, isoform A n=1 Tax=Clunio marinus TaxID=568069 RepID=A0A1J1J300_9DIPT|nr:CLUMA_CG019296, isoform A [Clunio marinus]